MQIAEVTLNNTHSEYSNTLSCTDSGNISSKHSVCYIQPNKLLRSHDDQMLAWLCLYHLEALLSKLFDLK